MVNSPEREGGGKKGIDVATELEFVLEKQEEQKSLGCVGEERKH